jgi:hypothetical protein
MSGVVPYLEIKQPQQQEKYGIINRKNDECWHDQAFIPLIRI